MGCKNCKKNPVISRRYSGEVLCKSCFFKSFEKNAQKELRKQINLLIKNSDIKIKKIGIGLSGGKDSTSIAIKLKFEFGLNPLLVTFSPLIVNECGNNNRNELSKMGFDSVFLMPNQKVSKQGVMVSAKVERNKNRQAF